jgi:hypothetical protein
MLISTEAKPASQRRFNTQGGSMQRTFGPDLADVETPIRRAATYSRMSTEHQNYSLEHQRIKFNAFAAANALTITQQVTWITGKAD